MAGEKGRVTAYSFLSVNISLFIFETIRDFDEDYDFWYRVCGAGNRGLFG